MVGAAVSEADWLECAEQLVQRLGSASVTGDGRRNLLVGAVATADAVLIELQRRDPDPFGWPALAALDCAEGASCLEALDRSPGPHRPVVDGSLLMEVPAAALLTGVRRLLAAAQPATVALLTASRSVQEARHLGDAAAALLRPLRPDAP